MDFGYLMMMHKGQNVHGCGSSKLEHGLVGTVDRYISVCMYQGEDRIRMLG